MNPKRFDWLHSIFAISLVLFSFQIWWRSWGHVEVESWSLLKMIVLIIPNILIYLCALFLVGEKPQKVRSWARFFDSSGQAMFGAFFANDAGDLNPQLLPRRSTTRAAGNNRKSGVLSWHGCGAIECSGGRLLVLVDASFIAVIFREL